ncbi:MAG: ABC transporter ATP-binding protein [Opitutales bacterium]
MDIESPSSPNSLSGGPDQPLVRARGVSLSYPGKPEPVRVVSNLDWSVRKGQITSLVGPSGCGKSSLIRLLCGVAAPGGGELLIDLPERPGARDLTVTFQSPTLLPWLTIEENAWLPFRLSGETPTPTDRETLSVLLETAGLAGVRQSYPHALSGGMAMRAAVVRSFLPRPKLILMDEPFAALDEVSRERMCQLLERMWLETPATVVFVTHNLSEAVLLSDRITVLASPGARILSEIDVPFERPRSLEIMAEPRFLNLVARLQRDMRHAEQGDPDA